MSSEHAPSEQPIAQAIGVGSVAIAGDNFAPISTRVFTGDWWRLEDSFLDPSPLLAHVDQNGFTERRWLVTELEEFITSVPSGYFLLEAEAGLGKTTFAAWLARAGGHACHFAGLDSRAREVSVAVRNLSAQLIAAWMLDELLDDGRLPPAAGESAWLGTVLTAAARRRDRDNPGSPILLIVDGLDEAIVDRPGDSPFGLPARLPGGVFVFATLQPGTDVPVGTAHVRRLNAQSPENIADMAEHVTRVSAESSFAARLNAAGVAPSDFCGLVLDRCQGVWIYMHYVLQEIRLGSRGPADLQTLPTDLQSYYSEKIFRWRNRSDWRERIRPIIATLTAAAEPLEAAVLAALSGIQDPGLVRDLLGDELRPFCIISRETNRDRFSLYHASLRRFASERGDGTALSRVEDLRSELSDAAQAAHCRIAERYLAAWGGLDQKLPLLAQDLTLADLDGGYGLRHVPMHLQACGRPRAARELLSCEVRDANLWYLASDRAGDIDGYLRTLNQIRTEAEAGADEALAKGHQASNLAFEIRCHFMTASVRSTASDIPPVVLKALVSYNFWTSQHGLNHIREISEERQRSASLSSIISLLPAELLPQAAKVARSLTDGRARVEALLRVSRRLAEPASQEMRAEALQVARSLTGEERAIALAHVASAAPANERRLLAGEALAAAQDAPYVYGISGMPRARSLAAVIPVLDESSRSEAMAEIRDLLWGERRRAPVQHLLSSLAAYLSPDEIDDLVGLTTTHPTPFAAELAVLLPYLPARRRDDLVEEALESVRSSPWHDPHPSQFLAILPFVPETKRNAVIEEAKVAAQRIRKTKERNTAFAWMVPYLSARERGTVLRELGSSSRMIRDAEFRCSLLLELSKQCADSETADILNYAWDEARQISDPELRAEMIAQIAPRLTRRNRRRAASEAVQCLEEADLGMLGFSALPAIARLIHPDVRLTRRMVKIARQPVQQFRGADRAVAVAEMAQYVPRIWSKVVWFWVNNSFVTVLSPETQQLTVAAKVAQFLPERKRHARLREAIMSGVRLNDEEQRARCLREIFAIMQDARLSHFSWLEWS